MAAERTVRVIVNRDACVGAGQCTRVAPEVFDQDEDDGLVILKAEHPGPGLADKAADAAGLCPARAIRIVPA